MNERDGLESRLPKMLYIMYLLWILNNLCMFSNSQYRFTTFVKEAVNLSGK